MIDIKSLLVQPLLKSSLPLLFGGGYYLLRGLLSSFRFLEAPSNSSDGDSFKLHEIKPKMLEAQSNGTSSGELIPDLLSLLDQVSFGIYSNIVAFLLVMMLFDVLFKVIQEGVNSLWEEVKSSWALFSCPYRGSGKEWRFSNVISENQTKRILSYALIFMLLQTAGLCLSLTQSGVLYSTSSSSSISAPQSANQGFEKTFRILEEEMLNEQHNPSLKMIPDKISLSMGNILSSLSLSVNSMVLSKDKKTAFVTLDYYGILNIIDISDLHSPFILSSLNLEVSSYFYRIKSLALSSDEKILYASDSKELEIIDVSDRYSPKLISLTKSEIFGIQGEYDGTSKYFKTSLAISESTKTLYIGGLGLQVYDVSDPKKPALLKAFKNDMTPENVLSRNQICLSRDGKTLFVANGTLDVYNISNPREMKQLTSLKTESSPRSIMLSEDFKTAFLLGTDRKNYILFEEMDISSLESLKTHKTVYLGHRSQHSPRFLAVSPSRSKFFIFADSDPSEVDLLIFDFLKQTTIKNQKSLIEETFTMDFSSDGKSLITGSNNQFLTIELFSDLPNSRIFSPSQENLIKNISLATSITQMKISEDEKYLFILRQEKEGFFISNSIFEIWDLGINRLLSSYNCSQSISKMHFTRNYETVYLLSFNSMLSLNITNKASIRFGGTYRPPSQDQRFGHFITSTDGKTGFLIIIKNEIGYVSFIDLSRHSEVTEGFVELEMKSKVSNSRLILKDDDRTLIVVNKEITIYDISNLSSPSEVASIPFGLNEPESYLNSHLLSPDNKTLFVETYDANGFSKLRIYDVSVRTSPQLISEKYFSKNEQTGIKPGFSLSPDLKSGFMFQENSLIKLNLTNLKQPKVSEIIALSSEKSYDIVDYFISSDGETIYSSLKNQIRILNMNPQFTLFLKQEKFSLGEKYSNPVAILNLAGGSYNLVNSDSSKIIKLSMFDIKIAPNKANLEMMTSPLPSWMTFDRETSQLTVEPKKQGDIGTYTLRSTFSLRIPDDAFENLGTEENPLSSEDLRVWLISLDYIDPQLYLTANFGGIEGFFLPSNFRLYREEIYTILKKYHVETCTSFEVVSSLELNNKSLPTVTSLSTSPIKVEIKLEPRDKVDAKFVNTHYGSLVPVLKENKTKISLEGTVKEVNLALNSVVVNFEGGTSCDANMVVNDGLNPPVSTGITNISGYFKSNKPPKLNNNTDQTLQEQINNADVQTGKYFTFTLPNDVFEDDYAEGLTYEMVMAQDDRAFPTWLSFNGLTLKGTPPEEVSGRDLDLVLIAKNEFKQYGVPFKLHIKISAVFWLKLVMRYSPYILTLIGLFVSANKIFNILRKGVYKHSKEFYVGVGEEISESVIFPVSFIKEEQKQSDLILKQFREKEVADFIDQDGKVIEKERIILKIKETIRDMPLVARKQITLYPSLIIDQIIINKFVWMQLNSEKETKTRSLFEDLGASCLDVVERDVSSPSGFAIDQEKFKKWIQRVEVSPVERNSALEESLIHHDPEVNIDLLKDAILAFAFENHSLNISPVDVDIGVKQKVPSNFLWRFLKLDLKDIYLNEKCKMDYGIKCRIVDDKLCFYGVSQNYLKGKTLVVQIKTLRQRIMKEIWIHGVSSDFQRDEIFMIKDEEEARGQGYEVY